MPSMFNKVQISGELEKDAALRYTPGGQAVVDFGLFLHSPGEKRKKGEVIRSPVPIVAHGMAAEECRGYLKKGNNLIVEGRLQSRSFTTIEGERKNILEVIAEKIRPLEKDGD